MRFTLILTLLLLLFSAATANAQAVRGTVWEVRDGQVFEVRDGQTTGGNGSTRGRGVAGTRSPGKPTARPLNMPGQNLDFSDYLKQGRVSIVYFYADWCPYCRQLSPVMYQLNRRPDKQVLFINIGTWKTPVTQQYGITSVPYLKIYDKKGNLVAEGNAARAWLNREMAKRR